MEDAKDLVQANSMDLSTLVDPGVLVKRAEQRALLVEKMREVAIRYTEPCHWIDYGGKPGLLGYGAEKMSRTIGLQTRDLNTVIEPVGDGAASLVISSGKVGFPGGEFVDAIGTCMTDKAFFNSKKDFDLGNIYKNAMTNLMVNGLNKFLTLGGLSWEDLEKITSGKVKKSLCEKIDYGSKNIERTSEEQQAADKMWHLIMEMSGNVVAKAKKQLQAITKFSDFDGYSDIKKISSKSLSINAPKVDKIYEGWCKKASATVKKNTESKVSGDISDAALAGATKTNIKIVLPRVEKAWDVIDDCFKEELAKKLNIMCNGSVIEILTKDIKNLSYLQLGRLDNFLEGNGLYQ